MSVPDDDFLIYTREIKVLSDKELKKIRKIYNTATEGEWKLYGPRMSSEWDVSIGKGKNERPLSGERGMFLNKEDAEFVVMAKKYIPKLLETIEELKGK